jgi:hypothetical protein
LVGVLVEAEIVEVVDVVVEVEVVGNDIDFEVGVVIVVDGIDDIVVGELVVYIVIVVFFVSFLAFLVVCGKFAVVNGVNQY